MKCVEKDAISSKLKQSVRFLVFDELLLNHLYLAIVHILYVDKIDLSYLNQCITLKLMIQNLGDHTEYTYISLRILRKTS